MTYGANTWTVHLSDSRIHLYIYGLLYVQNLLRIYGSTWKRSLAGRSNTNTNTIAIEYSASTEMMYDLNT